MAIFINTTNSTIVITDVPILNKIYLPPGGQQIVSDVIAGQSRQLRELVERGWITKNIDVVPTGAVNVIIREEMNTYLDSTVVTAVNIRSGVPVLGAIDGLNQIFAFENSETAVPSTFKVYYNGQCLKDADYTLLPGEQTFQLLFIVPQPLPFPDIILVDYIRG